MWQPVGVDIPGMASSRGRLWLALGVSPLAAPLAVWVGTLMHGLFNGAHTVMSANGMASAIFVAFVLEMFGAPLAYVSTFLIVWPLFHLLRSAGRASWWAVTLGGCVAGGALFPLYLHLLEPRGMFNFFSGAGFVAGAASAWTFWFIATRGEPRA